MIIDSTMTKKDYAKLNVSIALKSVAIRIFFALLFIWLIFAYLLVALANNYLILIIWFIFVVFFVVFYWFSINHFTNSKENSKFFLPMQFEFNDNVVLVTTPHGKEELNWDTFVKWRFIAGKYVLYVSSHTFFAIKSSNVKDQKEFEILLNEKVKNP